MYKRCISVCLILLLSIQMYGCNPDAENGKNETNIQYDTEEITIQSEGSEEPNPYNLLLQDIFNDEVRSLSENIYFYEDKLYIDYFGKPYVRLIFGRQGDEIVLLDTYELPSAYYHPGTMGIDHYLITGDESRQILWIYDLDTGNVEKFQVEENQKISCWDAKNGKIYLGVQTQKADAEIMSEIVIRGLEDGKEDVIALEEQLKRIYEMSVNDKGEIGILYVNADSAANHLGIIQDGQLTEIDTSDVEIWNIGRNEFHEFQLLDDKFMLCSEDTVNLLNPPKTWSYEVFFDGSWGYIPYNYCEPREKNMLEGVTQFYYVKDYYLAYRNFRPAAGYPIDVDESSVVLCTLDGKCCKEINIPKSDRYKTSVYFVCSDESVYVISINGENYKMNVQSIPLNGDDEMQKEYSPITYDSWLEGQWVSTEWTCIWTWRRTADTNVDGEDFVGEEYSFSQNDVPSMYGGAAPIRDRENQYLFWPQIKYSISELNLEGKYYAIINVANLHEDDMNEHPCLIVKNKDEMLITKDFVGAYTICRRNETEKHTYDVSKSFESNIQDRMTMQGIGFDTYYPQVWGGYWTIEDIVYTDDISEAQKNLGKEVAYMGETAPDCFDIQFIESEQDRIFYDMPTVSKLGLEGEYYVIIWSETSEFPAAIVKSEHEMFLIKGDTVYRAVQEETYYDFDIVAV